MRKFDKIHPIKVLLLNPPFSEVIIRDNYCCFTSKSGYLWPPIDLVYVSAILNTGDFHLEVVDAVADKVSWTQVEDKFKKNSYDVVISMTGTVSFNSDMPSLGKLKKKYRFRLFMMGNTPAFMPQEFLREYKFVDGIFHNFFEIAIAEAVAGKKVISSSITMNNRKGDEIGSVNRLERVNLPNPPRYDLFPLNKYGTMFSKKSPLTTALLTYGCPFKCSFCIASEIMYKPRDIDNIRIEFESMKENGVKEIFFQDSTFNTDPKRFKQVLDLLSEYKFSWSANIHSFHLPIEVIKKMKQVGCHTIQIGVESGDQSVLNKYAPSKRMEIIDEVVERCREVGVRTLGYFIVGFPTDTHESIKKTINFAIKLDTDFVSFSMMTPDYGTKLYRDTLQNSASSKKSLRSFDSSGGVGMGNENLSQKELDKYLFLAYIKFYLRPSKILQYLSRPSYLWLYTVHATRLFSKQLRQYFGGV